MTDLIQRLTDEINPLLPKGCRVSLVEIPEEISEEDCRIMVFVTVQQNDCLTADYMVRVSPNGDIRTTRITELYPWETDENEIIRASLVTAVRSLDNEFLELIIPEKLQVNIISDLLKKAEFGINKQRIQDFMLDAAIRDIAKYLISHGVSVNCKDATPCS